MLDVMLAGGAAMLVALLGTPLFIRLLVRRGHGQPIRDDLVEHHVERGEPTLGGTVIIAATLIGCLCSHAVLAGADAGGLVAVTHDPVSVSALVVLLTANTTGSADRCIHRWRGARAAESATTRSDHPGCARSGATPATISTAPRQRRVCESHGPGSTSCWRWPPTPGEGAGVGRPGHPTRARS